MSRAITNTKKIKAKPKRETLLNVKRGKIDYMFLLLVVLLLTIGVLSLFSASFSNALDQYGDSYHFISRQVIFAVGGIFLMLFVSTINYRMYDKLVWIIYITTIVLLIIVFFFPEINGANRWIVLLNRITFQPSELAKFAVVILFSHLITLNYSKMKDFREGLLLPIMFLVPIAVLVVLEPHLSATVIILALAAIMLFIGGLDLKWFIVLAVVGALFLFLVLPSYGGDRIEIWLNPEADPLDKGYQTLQSLYAIGSGGLMGKGIGGSTQKYQGRLPEIQNDYVFAIVCEELGFIGAVMIILLFALLVWRGFIIANRCKDRFGSLVAIGLVSQIGVQVLFNLAVITNTVPPTGVSFPLFSSGGTSLMMLLMQMGIILSVSRRESDEYAEVEVK